MSFRPGQRVKINSKWLLFRGLHGQLATVTRCVRRRGKTLYALKLEHSARSPGYVTADELEVAK